MALPQVEIASSSPFGCANHCDAPATTHTTLKKNKIGDNLKVSFDYTPKSMIEKHDTWVLRVAKNNLGSLTFKRRFHNVCKDNKNDSSLSALISPRHSKVIDPWAANTRQEAREMVSTTHGNSEVEVMDNFPSRSPNCNSIREVTPPYSNGSSEGEVSILGASSLVKIWEKRFNNKSNNNCTKSNAPAFLGRTSSDTSNTESAFSVEEQCRVSEEGDEPPQGNEKSFLDGEECDKTGPCDQSCSTLKVQSTTSNDAESEKVRVADIIKRLTVTNQMQSSTVSFTDDNDNELCSTVTRSPYRDHDLVSYTPKQQEHRVFASPRIRGRQAFNDLLMQFQSDRHGELNNLAERGAVSNFTQRGRLQSSLRLRLLQRGIAVFDQSRLKSAAFEANRQQESGTMQLRKRLNTGDEGRTLAPTKLSNSISPLTEIVSSITQTDNFPTSPTGADNKGTHPNSDVTFRETSFEAQNDGMKETVRASLSMTDSNANEMVHKVLTCDQQRDTTEISHDEILEEEASDQQYAASSYDELGEEEEAGDSNYYETSYDWTSPISRPRSYWEERRQEWYREKLDFGSENDEICKLLERRAVSTFLSSDFCERLDRLMTSYMGTQSRKVSSQCDVEHQEGSTDQFMAFYQERLSFRGIPQEDGRDRAEKEDERKNEEEEEEEDKAEEQEEESIISSSDHEGDYQSSPSTHAPSPSSWSYRDNDAGDYSDRVGSMSSPPYSQSQSFYQDSQQYPSSTNHLSTEMEFLYDMRGQMVQLFREMFELRKSINTCMDMQMQMQVKQSKNQEVHTVKGEEKFNNNTPKNGNCCICHKKKVNSLLYRCGHMCACLKCANELRWNSGKCPICQASIIDVVRVHAET